MSRNTQGGLGHRLRGRRGGNARHRHQLSSSGGGSRTGEMGGREEERGAKRVGRGFSLVTPRSSRARRRRAEQATTRERDGNTAAGSRARECGKAAPETPVFMAKGRGLRTSQRPASRARGAGPAAAGAVGGAEGEGRPCSAPSGASQVLGPLPALARPPAPGGVGGPRPSGACAPRRQRALRLVSPRSSSPTAARGPGLGPPA